MNDIFDRPSALVPSAALDQLNNLIAEGVELEEVIAGMSENLKGMQSRLGEIKRELIPLKMAEAGIGNVYSHKESGAEVKLKQFVSGSLPKEEKARAAALKFLEENDAADLIKTDLTLSFGRNSDNEVKSVAALLKEQGYEPTLDKGVHPATLQSFVRERIKNGEDVPFETLGVFAGTTADIKIKKQK